MHLLIFTKLTKYGKLTDIFLSDFGNPKKKVRGQGPAPIMASQSFQVVSCSPPSSSSNALESSTSTYTTIAALGKPRATGERNGKRMAKSMFCWVILKSSVWS